MVYLNAKQFNATTFVFDIPAAFVRWGATLDLYLYDSAICATFQNTSCNRATSLSKAAPMPPTFAWDATNITLLDADGVSPVAAPAVSLWR
jgi:hypothetical protein